VTTSIRFVMPPTPAIRETTSNGAPQDHRARALGDRHRARVVDSRIASQPGPAGSRLWAGTQAASRERETFTQIG
jgi:hypothetical protein